MCYNLQSIARAPVTIVSSSVDHRLGSAQPETSLVAGLPVTEAPIPLAGLVRRHRYPSTKHSMGATLSKPPTEKMVDF